MIVLHMFIVPRDRMKTGGGVTALKRKQKKKVLADMA
jgi:hypothetical protein